MGSGTWHISIRSANSAADCRSSASTRRPWPSRPPIQATRAIWHGTRIRSVDRWLPFLPCRRAAEVRRVEGSSTQAPVPAWIDRFPCRPCRRPCRFGSFCRFDRKAGAHFSPVVIGKRPLAARMTVEAMPTDGGTPGVLSPAWDPPGTALRIAARRRPCRPVAVIRRRRSGPSAYRGAPTRMRSMMISIVALSPMDSQWASVRTHAIACPTRVAYSFCCRCT